MKVVIPGGSGQVGRVLARAFHRGRHEVVVLSRRLEPCPWRVIEWTGRTAGDWVAEIDGADVVINLTGRSVNCRSTPANRQEILQSRVESTRVVGEAIARARRPPSVWLQASAATIYTHRYDAPNDERSGEIGGAETTMPDAWRFSVGVVSAWERAFSDAITPATRKVALRTSLMMGPDSGGVFDTLVSLVRRGLGGAAGDGRQFMSWVHHADVVDIVRFLIDRSDISGAVNVASPSPLPNAEFMRELRRACGVSFGLPATRWMLETGAVLMQTETELILKSRRVVPTRLLESGFEFRFPHWSDAARDLYGEWKAMRRPVRSAA